MKLKQLQSTFLGLSMFTIILAMAQQIKVFGLNAFFGLGGLYIFTTVLASVYLAWSISKAESDSDFEFDKLEKVSLVIWSVVLFVFKAGELTKLGLWFDELVQLFNVVTKPALEGAALHIQPPLTYAIQNLFVGTFGTEDWAVRLYSWIFSYLGMVLFFALVLFISRNIFITFAFSLLLQLNPWFLNYSIDARPISVGFFFLMILSTQVLLDGWNVRFGAIKNEPFKWILYRYAALVYLFLSSLALQPLVGVSALILTGGICLLKKDQIYSKFLKSLIVGGVAGIVLYLPLQYKMMELSAGKFIQTSSLSVLSRFQNINWAQFLNVFNTFKPYFLIGLVFVVLFLFKLLIDRYKKRTSAVLYPAVGILFSVIFYLLEGLIFAGPAQFHFSPHYCLLGLPLIFIGCAAIYNFLKASKIIMIVALLSIPVLWPKFTLSYGQQNGIPIGHPDLRSAYDYVLRDSSQKDLVLSLSFPLKNWSPVESDMGAFNYYRHQQRRYDKSFAEIAVRSEIPVLRLYKELKENNNLENLYIVYIEPYDQIGFAPESIKDLEFIEIKKFDMVFVIKLKNLNVDKLKKWERFLISIPSADSSWVYIALRLQLDILKKDKSAFLEHFEKFKTNVNEADNFDNFEKFRRFFVEQAQSEWKIAL